MKSTLELIYRKVGKELGVKPSMVETIYKSYWGFIRKQIEELPLRDISEEEFDALDHNFNIPYIGKLYVEYDKIKKYTNRLNYYKNVKLKKD